MSDETNEEKKLCPSCNAELSETAKYCPNCGAALESEVAVCPSCNTEVAVDAKFCPNCGQSFDTTSDSDISVCPACNAEIGDDAKFCPSCGQAFEITAGADVSEEAGRVGAKVAINRNSMLGIAGAVTLFVGAFMPIVSAPIIGSLNYFQNGRGDGVIIVIIAAISLALALVNKHKWLLLTGLASLGILIFTFIQLQTNLSSLQDSLNTDLADNPFKGLAQAAMQSVQLQWGWAVLIVGSGLLIASALLPEEGPEEE